MKDQIKSYILRASSTLHGSWLIHNKWWLLLLIHLLKVILGVLKIQIRLLQHRLLNTIAMKMCFLLV